MAVDREKALQWKMKNGNVVDRNRNTILHAAAAFGAIDTLWGLMDGAKIIVDVENENAETLLYRAFQVGHTKVIEAAWPWCECVLQNSAEDYSALAVYNPRGFDP